ncbi:MAG: hypothetical protein ABJN62_16030 [Halioglobus sp.]
MVELLSNYLPFLLFWGSVLSVATLVATVLAVPWVVARLPADYFSTPRRHPLREQQGLGAWALSLLKNILGGLLLLIGVVLLFMPGQGILMMLVGLLIMNFPGKYRLERILVAREGVFRALNWLRTKRSLPPFEPLEPKI